MLLTGFPGNGGVMMKQRILEIPFMSQASLLVLQKRILKIISQERERLVFWNSFSVLDVFQDCFFIFIFDCCISGKATACSGQDS